MKRVLSIALFLVTAVLLHGQNKNAQLELNSFKELTSNEILDHVSSFFKEEWPQDFNGDKDCACVKVKFENMSDDDARKVAFNFGNTAPVSTTLDRLGEEDKELWLFVTPSKMAFMEASLQNYGMTNRLPDIKLEPKHIYQVILTNKKKMSINIITNPDLILATLETGQETLTPATFTDVSLGRHTITLSDKGKTLRTEEIVVSESNVRFEYDLRKRKMVNFTSNPSGAVLYINSEEAGKTPLSVELPYGSYKVRAERSSDETDERSFTINDNSPSEISLEPVRKKTFNVMAYFGGVNVNADLYVNGKREGKQQSSYMLTRPIGKEYNISMTYNGYSKDRIVKVSSDMDNIQKIKISKRKYFVWPWQRDYEPVPMGLSVSYVKKQLVTSGGGEDIKEDGIWGKRDKYLNGIQAGVIFQPCFSFGLGLHTGLFYELYMSEDKEGDHDGYYKYSEHSLYAPVHLYFRVPFARRVALSLHAGFGFSYVVHGEISGGSRKEEQTGFYGEDGYPQRLNVTAEFGAGFRIGAFQINAQYGMGISDHKTYKFKGNEYKTVQNRLSAGLAYLF